MASRKVPKRPRDARTFDDIWNLPRDNVSVRDYYLGFNHEGELYLGFQRRGERPEWSGTISRRAFERLIDWYNGVPAPRRRKRGGGDGEEVK